MALINYKNKINTIISTFTTKLGLSTPIINIATQYIIGLFLKTYK